MTKEVISKIEEFKKLFDELEVAIITGVHEEGGLVDCQEIEDELDANWRQALAAVQQILDNQQEERL